MRSVLPHKTLTGSSSFAEQPAARTNSLCCCATPCRETLRLSNVVSSLAVEAAQDLQLGEWAVPAGTAMAIPFIQLAKNDPRWLNDEPEAFRCVQVTWQHNRLLARLTYAVPVLCTCYCLLPRRA